MKAKSHSFLSAFRAEMRDSFFMATGAIRAHTLRSSLTLLGVMVGVFSIIVVMTAMRAMQHQIETNLDRLGRQTFMVQKWPGLYFGGPEGTEKYWRRKDITLAQGMQVRNRAALARTVGLEISVLANEITSHVAKAPPGFYVNGDTPGSFAAQDWVLQDGRILQDADIDGGRSVCVLGNSLATNLFPFGSPLEEKIKINGISYAVVGVLEPKGTMQGGNQDNFAVIPITTALNRFGSRRSISILVQAPDSASYDDTLEQVRGVLRVARKVPPGKEDDFEIFSNDSMLAQINTFTYAVRMGVGVISSIALLASGIGIMNIMLVSVTERTREIGVRRAVGARKRNIMVQFIMEAVVLCELGGALGVVFGVIVGNVGAHFLKMAPVIPFDWVAIGMGICSVVGIVFGTYPAYKAANLDPIESLRYE